MKKSKVLTMVIAMLLLAIVPMRSVGTPDWINANRASAQTQTNDATQENLDNSPRKTAEEPARTDKLDPDSLKARAAILIDTDTGNILFAKNADARMAPASTTKIMTLLLGLERDNLDEMITVPQSAGKAPSDSTRVPVWPGETMPYRDLLYGLMIKSGNDAANAIATLSAGSVDQFVQRMNRRAAELGMSNTHFVNAHGYPAEGHYASARDLAQLTRVALQNQAFRTVIEAREYTMRATNMRDEKTLGNAYAILDPQSSYYYPGAFGVKTGYSIASGQCYVSAATRNGRTLISVVLHSALTKPDKWIDTATLFNYGFGL